MLGAYCNTSLQENIIWQHIDIQKVDLVDAGSSWLSFLGFMFYI
jgi:hypothetical protein